MTGTVLLLANTHKLWIFTRATPRRSKRGLCYSNVAGWLAG